MITSYNYYMESNLIFPQRKELTSVRHKIKSPHSPPRKQLLFLNLGPIKLATARKLLKTHKRQGGKSKDSQGVLSSVIRELALNMESETSLAAQGDNFRIYDMEYHANRIPKELIPYANFSYPQENTHYSDRRHWGLVRSLDGETLRLRKNRGTRNYRIADLELHHPSGFHHIDTVSPETLANPEMLIVIRYGEEKGNTHTILAELGEQQTNGSIRTTTHIYVPHKYKSEETFSIENEKATLRP